MKEEWYIAVNNRPRRYDCVKLIKERGYYSIYRCIDDVWEDGDDSPYNMDEYLNLIPEICLLVAIGAKTDRNVKTWVKSNLIKKQSNSLDKIEAFLKEHNIPFEYGHTYVSPY